MTTTPTRIVLPTPDQVRQRLRCREAYIQAQKDILAALNNTDKLRVEALTLMGIHDHSAIQALQQWTAGFDWEMSYTKYGDGRDVPETYQVALEPARKHIPRDSVFY